MNVSQPLVFAQATIHEIAAHWNKHPNTVRYHLDRGHFRGRKAPTVWLVEVGTVIALWGLPAADCADLLCA